MQLRALHSAGKLDISHKGFIEGTNHLPPLNVTLSPGQTYTLADEYRQTANISGAINAGLLEVINYATTPGSLVVNPELTDVEATLDTVQINYLDTDNNRLYFSTYNTLIYQVEIYKYTKKKIGSHEHKDGITIYTDHIGKRYKVLYQVAQEALYWIIDNQWINQNRFSYFKLGLFHTENQTRGPMSVKTVRAGHGRIETLG